MAPKADDDPTCRLCGRPYSEHTGTARCEVCGRYEMCHPPGGTDECWAGRARMAHARRDAGEPLDTTDAEALRRHPDRAEVAIPYPV